jgi:MoaA/NifB/PqqE/SkfB family radical SAM enzyme
MAVFCIWNKCNSHCVMCSNPSKFQEEDPYKGYSLELLKERIRGTKILDDKICLTGGEPTIHPDFFKLISFIREKFPKIVIELDTNGRRFFYPSFAERLLKFGRINICISLHGFDAKSHDAVTRTPGSFKQTVEGLENIFKYSHLGLNEIEIRIIITKITCEYTEKILKLIKERFPQLERVVIVFMEMEGQAGDNLKLVGLTYTYFRKFIPKIARWIPLFKDLRFYHFPLCMIDHKYWPYVWRTLTPEENETDFLPSCKRCRYKKYCLGIHKDYLKLIGGKEFNPIKKKISLKVQDDFFHPILKVYRKHK